MLYLLGVNLPDHKTVPIALTHIYGIGTHTSETLCHKLGIHPRCRLSDLPEAKITELSALLNTMQIDAELRRETRNKINVMVQSGRYRGARHKAGLPVNGQRTHTNRMNAKRLNGRWMKAREFSSSRMPFTQLSIPRPPSSPVRSLSALFKPLIRMVSCAI